MDIYTPSSTTFRRRPSAGSARLERSVEHARHGWFPPNSDIVNSIFEKAKANCYAQSTEALVEEVKTDPALLSICLRELKRNVESPRAIDNPIRALKNQPYEKVVEWISLPGSKISPYKLKSASKTQIQRLRETSLSCHSTEVVAKGAELDPDLAFSCAFLRQLGINLIAWNYPSHFKRAQQATTRGESLDAALKRILGVTPEDMSLEIAKEWQVSSELMKIIAPPNAASAKNGQEVSPLQTACEIGETYAKLRDPEQRAAAESAWKVLKQKAVQWLGPDPEAQLVAEAESIEALFETPVPDESDPITEARFHKNSFASRCPLPLKKSLHRVYEQIVPSAPVSEALRSLAGEVLPEAGFIRGCIFLARPGSFDLVPVMKFGDQPLSYYRLSRHAARNGMTEALMSSFPMRQDVSWFGADESAALTGRLGKGGQQAVLYLELSKSAREDAVHQAMLYFNAIRQAFNDCLSI
jgi:hypothetical protein